jgi:hypothetical protein
MHGPEDVRVPDVLGSVTPGPASNRWGGHDHPVAPEHPSEYLIEYDISGLSDQILW